MLSAGEYHDHAAGDLESGCAQTLARNSIASDLLKRLDRCLSGSSRRLRVKLRPDSHRAGRRLSSSPSPISERSFSSNDGAEGDGNDILGDSAPPEWALLLIGCLLGVATGLFVTAFNRGVHVIHEWAWAGTPNEGASWLRLQRLADTWHRILLIPVLGGVVVGVLHGLLEILNQINSSTSSQGQGFDMLAGILPVVKAIHVG